MATNFIMKELTLSVVKKHLNIDDSFTEDDDYLVQLISAVLNLIIKRLNLKPINRDERNNISEEDEVLDFDNLEEVEEIKEVPNDGVYESNECLFRRENLPSKCYYNLTDDKGFCKLCCPYLELYRKLYYEPALLHGMLLLIGNLYANREPITQGTISKIPYTLDYLLEPYKNYSIC